MYFFTAVVAAVAVVQIAQDPAQVQATQIRVMMKLSQRKPRIYRYQYSVIWSDLQFHQSRRQMLVTRGIWLTISQINLRLYLISQLCLLPITLQQLILILKHQWLVTQSQHQMLHQVKQRNDLVVDHGKRSVKIQILTLSQQRSSQLQCHPIIIDQWGKERYDLLILYLVWEAAKDFLKLCAPIETDEGGRCNSPG